MRVVAAILLVLALGVVPAAAQGTELEIVLDCSGSMMAPVGGRARITIAKETLLNLLEKIPDGTRVGLRAYAHRYPAGQDEESRKRSCMDTELLVPIGPIQKALIREKVAALKCVGMTPIAYSLEVAAGDFTQGDVQRTIILLSDGKETCGGDSVALLTKLKSLGFKVMVHVIGFDVDAATASELNAIAVAGGGKYYDVKKAEQLAEGLQDAVQQAIPAFRAKDQLVFTSWVEAVGAEVVDEKEGRVTLKLAGGNQIEVPAHACFAARKLPPEKFQVGTGVLATQEAVGGKPTVLHYGTILESKDNKLRVSLQGRDTQLWVPAEFAYEMPWLDEQGEAVPLEVHKSPKTDKPEWAAEQMLAAGYDGGQFHPWRQGFPWGVTLKVSGEPREIRRIGLLPAIKNALPVAAELYVGGPTDTGFAWTSVGILEFEDHHYWQFFRFPPVKAQYVHVRFLKPWKQYVTLRRLRVYEQEGTMGRPVKENPNPQPPVGEAGDAEKRASEMIVGEGEGRYRRIKLLKRQGEEVLGLTADGKKVTVPAAQAFPLEPIDVAKAELGDDVLVNDAATGGAQADLYVTAVLTEVSPKQVKIQLGAKEFSAPPDQIFRAPKK